MFLFVYVHHCFLMALCLLSAHVFNIFTDFGVDGDPEASLRQYWANIEVRQLPKQCSSLLTLVDFF